MVVEQFGRGWIYWCPDCGITHRILASRHQFINHDKTKPTFMPGMKIGDCVHLIRDGFLHYADGRTVPMESIYE